MEAADLGVRLCQHAVRSVYLCYGLVAVPVIALAMASFGVATWLPSLVIWWAKPWLDRTILFVLARTAFNQRTAPGDLWREQRQVWWRQIVFTWTVRRFSPWRSLTQPVYQLEGFSILTAGPRVRQIRRGKAGTAFLMTSAFALAEGALTGALVSLLFWFAPSGQTPDLLELLSGEQPAFALAWTIAYGVAVLFLEPFFVAAGFAMYLTRRAELEAWDIEQEFRRAFAH